MKLFKIWWVIGLWCQLVVGMDSIDNKSDDGYSNALESAKKLSESEVFEDRLLAFKLFKVLVKQKESSAYEDAKKYCLSTLKCTKPPCKPFWNLKSNALKILKSFIGLGEQEMVLKALDLIKEDAHWTVKGQALKVCEAFPKDDLFDSAVDAFIKRISPADEQNESYLVKAAIAKTLEKRSGD